MAGTVVSRELRQRPTRGEAGPAAIVAAWLQGAEAFLAENNAGWSSVAGVGLAIPGPYLGYGVLGKMPNLPAELEGWHFLRDLTEAVCLRAGRSIPVVTANDGLLAGVAEAQIVQQSLPGSVLMLAPGSGLGCSYVGADGDLLHGDHQAAVILCHMPAPYEVLGLPRFRCGCGRDWGCFEAYSSISGLPQLLNAVLPEFPHHPFAAMAQPGKPEVLALRSMAQEGDALALRIFDLQAQALGLAVATGCMAYDPTHVIIGGGLMDREATTSAFRQSYLETVRRSAASYLWIDPQSLHYHEASLGDLSQAIGAALYVRKQAGQ